MLNQNATLLWLLAFSTLFAVAGVLYARRQNGSLEDFVVARNSQSALATILTLLASSLGAWILFSPAQAATWGGLSAVIGYALGSMSPRLVMIPLGKRMRELLPRGHSLTEFVIARYGRPMYALTLLIMLFYMFIAMTAEITAMSKMITLIAPIPLWVTASVVLVATLIYTSYGGLRASIFTDKVQMLVIVPMLFLIVLLGWQAVGGPAQLLRTVELQAPRLVELSDPVGVKAGLTFFVAILLTGLFHQGNWQRIYSARSDKAMRNGFLLGGLFVAPFIFLMGLFGLAFVGLGGQGDSSVALFNVILPQAPVWFLVLLIPLGLSLVMSSADTVISAVSSLVAVDLGRLMPQRNTAQMMRLARWLVWLSAIPVLVASSQGYSVLYLFLLADLLCSAAAFPVFFGLYSRRYDGITATLSTVAGLAAGLAIFPRPDGPLDYLLESFVLAAVVPALVTAIIMPLRRRLPQFDFGKLAGSTRVLDQN